MADRRFIFGAESAYGTQATTWRRLQVATDDHKTRRDPLDWRGIGGGGGATSLATYTTRPKGGTGTVATPLLSNGLGLFNRAAGTTFTSGVVTDGTLAYEQVTTFGNAGAPANRSISTVAYRDQEDGTITPFIYKGGVVTQVELAVEVDQYVMITYTLDYKTVTRAAPTGPPSPVTVEPDLLFPWDLAKVTVTNLDTDADFTDCVKSFKLTLPLELDVDDYCINLDDTKHRPTRAGLPDPSMELTWKYQDPRYYDAFVDNTPFGLVFHTEGLDPIEDTTVPSFDVEIPAFVYNANDPEMSVDSPTMQTMPCKVLDNGTDPVATFTQITSDSAF